MEFIVDTVSDEFYFMEMNTRLQVLVLVFTVTQSLFLKSRLTKV